MVKRLIGWSLATIASCVGLEAAARVLGRASTRARVAPGRALLVYDDDCGLCSRVARFVERGATVELQLVGFSELPLDGVLEGLSERELWASAHFVSSEGMEYHGGESVTQAARLLPGGQVLAQIDRPVLRALREIGYRLVVWQRARISPWLNG
jgi:predicted DCC family thiol-disulfide oxidoreductase YuxK